ncbi:MAG: helix-turn-helix transcriptional regulator [Vagococcus salmoninarum]|uniref:helix-turn-helix transcriptional regulator n=1 Tax=Vagococcus salmoninarum TaxID=2739 RepID=UPI003F96B16F
MKNKIAGYRKMMGYNQEELGHKLGISRQSYYLKENGKVQFSDREKVIFKELLTPIFSDITIDKIFFE